jgi:hypothetical protein
MTYFYFECLASMTVPLTVSECSKDESTSGFTGTV